MSIIELLKIEFMKVKNEENLSFVLAIKINHLLCRCQTVDKVHDKCRGFFSY